MASGNPFSSVGGVRTMYKKLVSDEGRLARLKEKSEEAMRETLNIAAIGGSALALGYANARYGDPQTGEYKVAGKVPLDLGIAVLFHVTAFAGLFGKKYNEIGHNVGSGALAVYAARKGAKFGQDARNKGSQQATGDMFYGPWNPAAMGGHAPNVMSGWSNTGHAPVMSGAWGPGAAYAYRT